MDGLEPYLSLAVALSTGLLIGLEREQSQPDPAQHRSTLGGVRTYPLFSLLGAVSMLLTRQLGAWPLVVAAAGTFTLVAVSYARDVQSGHHGLTSEGAFALNFLLGALALSQGVVEPPVRKLLLVAAIAVVATLLLNAKPSLRAFSARVSRADVFATVKFLIVAVVVLPLLPDEPMGPYGALNPFGVGTMVVLIAGIGFVGYVAVRWLGPGRGMAVTGAVGGLVSSTAVTLAMAGRAKATPALADTCALSTLLACALMFGRVLLAVLAVNPKLLPGVLVPLAAMAAATVGAAALLYVRSNKQAATAQGLELVNPFELTSAMKFGALFALILVVSRWATTTLGTTATYVAGAVAGTTDVDAITLSMSRLFLDGAVTLETASTTIVIATASNTVVKGALAFISGGRAFGLRVGGGMAAALVAGAVAVALQRLR